MLEDSKFFPFVLPAGLSGTAIVNFMAFQIPAMPRGTSTASNLFTQSSVFARRCSALNDVETNNVCSVGDLQNLLLANTCCGFTFCSRFHRQYHIFICNRVFSGSCRSHKKEGPLK